MMAKQRRLRRRQYEAFVVYMSVWHNVPRPRWNVDLAQLFVVARFQGRDIVLCTYPARATLDDLVYDFRVEAHAAASAACSIVPNAEKRTSLASLFVCLLQPDP